MANELEVRKLFVKKNEFQKYVQISVTKNSLPILAVVKKYSNFVGFPVILDGKQINTLQPIWLMDPKKVTESEYNEFYRFISNVETKPQYTIHYKVRNTVHLSKIFILGQQKCHCFST